MRTLAIALLFAAPLFAQEAVRVAQLVNEEAIDATQLGSAIASKDASMRATAARVAMVRGVTAVLPAIASAVVAEQNAEAAREQIRALAMLGSDELVALAAKQLERFPASLDADFAEAIARRGAPAATTLYLKHQPSLRAPGSFVAHALWGRADLASATAARHLGASMTLEEQQALRGDIPVQSANSPSSTTVRPSSFLIPILLPTGLGEAILRDTRCRGGWIGSAFTTVDRAGRVQSVDMAQLRATSECKRAAQTLLRLSLADPASIVAPVADFVQMVKPSGFEGCFAEEAPHGGDGTLFRVGGDVKPPQILQRVDPQIPANVRRSMTEKSIAVTAESIITKEGCVRDIRLLTQGRYGELNAAALLALAKWKFRPGTLNGQPVDVIFNLTVNFRIN